MAKIRNEELGQFAGELLPERTVLSALPMDAGSSAFCSPNTQTISTSGNLLAIVGATNQCGLFNTAQSIGVGLLNILG